MIPRYFVVAESTHEIQNPTSREKLLDLGRRLELAPGSHILDIASGRAVPPATWPSVSRTGAVGHWLAANPDDPDAAEIRSRHEGYKRNYLRHQRDHLGWAIFVGWKGSLGG